MFRFQFQLSTTSCTVSSPLMVLVNKRVPSSWSNASSVDMLFEQQLSEFDQCQRTVACLQRVECAYGAIFQFNMIFHSVFYVFVFCLKFCYDACVVVCNWLVCCFSSSSCIYLMNYWYEEQLICHIDNMVRVLVPDSCDCLLCWLWLVCSRSKP